ncbi:hypothetical protein QC820_16570, partial [Halomonas mongoliensis]
AGAMARRGELRERVRHKRYLGGVTIGGGILAIAASSLVLVPLVIGVISLVLVYRLARLVPWHIETWLRRSLYGVQSERLRFQPFANGLEEQDSLTMVFSGIEFDMEALRATVSSGEIGPATTRPATDRQAWAAELAEEGRRIVPDHYTLNLTATASFPEDLAGELTVLINYLPEQGKEHYLGGSKYTGGSLVRVNEHGQELTSSGSADVVGAQASASDSHGFILQAEGERKTMLFETDIDAVGGRLETRIIYVAEDGLPRPDALVMELSR